MHFKNGRLAREGDPVICRGYNGSVTVGKIHTLLSGCETCNATVAEVVPGGVNQLTCRTIGDMYHAEDALAAVEAIQPKCAPKPPAPEAEALPG